MSNNDTNRTPASPDLLESLLTIDDVIFDSNISRSTGSPSSYDNDNSYTHSKNDLDDSDLVEGRRNAAPKSKNINLILVYTLLSFAARSLWSNSVLTAFVYLIRSDNLESVGFITAIMGISQIIASVPSAILADRYRRDTILKAGSVMGILGIITTTAATLTHNYILLVVALAIWGIFLGISVTVVVALFADSIHDGDRSYYFTKRMIMLKLGNTLGPLTALFMFLFLGNKWQAGDCAIIMLTGQALCLPPVVLLCWMNDRYIVKNNTVDQAVSDSSQNGDGLLNVEDVFDTKEIGSSTSYVSLDSKSRNSGDTGISWSVTSNLRKFESTSIETYELGQEIQFSESLETVTSGDLSYNHQQVTRELYPLKETIEPLLPPLTSDQSKTESDASLSDLPRERFIPADKYIPVLIALSDVMAGLASGMSIRYFPIFFMHHLHLSPVWVQLIFVASPMAQIALGNIAQIGGERYGRVQVAAAFKWIGISFMLSMLLSHHFHLPTPLICVLFVFRSSFMNSTGALTKSILMDEVPQHERAKWSALESINMFTWSGSALFGGILVSKKGMLFNFYLTMCLQALSTIPLAMLFGHVKKEVRNMGP